MGSLGQREVFTFPPTRAVSGDALPEVGRVPRWPRERPEPISAPPRAITRWSTWPREPPSPGVKEVICQEFYLLLVSCVWICCLAPGFALWLPTVAIIRDFVATALVVRVLGMCSGERNLHANSVEPQHTRKQQ